MKRMKPAFLWVSVFNWEGMEDMKHINILGLKDAIILGLFLLLNLILGIPFNIIHLIAIVLEKLSDLLYKVPYGTNVVPKSLVQRTFPKIRDYYEKKNYVEPFKMDEEEAKRLRARYSK